MTGLSSSLDTRPVCSFEQNGLPLGNVVSPNCLVLLETDVKSGGPSLIMPSNESLGSVERERQRQRDTISSSVAARKKNV